MNTEIVNRLCHFYRVRKRDLPWRRTTDPYRIWLSEIMLQQTRVEAVKDYYAAFLRELPDIRALADCPDDRLMKLWEGLGYYSRARNLKKAAQMILHDFDGQFPSAYEEILSLPGVGEYTAGAVASIAFGRRVPAVDGNVLRVMARLYNSEENILEPAYKKKVREELLAAVQTADVPGDFNQALIELGAIVCVPNGAPHCEECPLQDDCLAYREQTTDHIPVRIKKQKKRIEQRTILLVRDGEETAVGKRPDTGLLAGLYEFPSLPGHVSEEEAVKEVEAHNMTALRIRPLPPAKHLFSHVTWEMSGYEIRVFRGGQQTSESDWIFAENEEIQSRYALPSAFSAYARLLTLKTGKQRLT